MLAAILSLGLASHLTSAQPACFETWQVRKLPANLEWAKDFRRNDEGNFVILSHEGIFTAEESTFEATLLVAGGQGRNDLFHPWSLGVSRGRVVVGSGAFSYGEIDLSRRSVKAIHPFADPEDLDIRGDDLAILGAQQGEKGP